MSIDQSRPTELNNVSFPAADLFDSITDTVYFVKDSRARYVAVNYTLVQRCALRTKAEMLGRTVQEVFPSPRGDSFAAQDQEVVRRGSPVRGKLELHLYPGGQEDWCLTWKEPLFDSKGLVMGLVGVSRDLPPRSPVDRFDLGGVAKVLDFIASHLDQPMPPDMLASMAGLSTYQLDRRIGELFGVSTAQYIIRTRIEHARFKLTRSDEQISFIAHDCGYSDQSSFTRQFRRSVGLTPNAYRKTYGTNEGG